MPVSKNWFKKASYGAFNFINKEDVKAMTPQQKDDLYSAFKKECLMAASDVQEMVDFMTEVVLVVNTAPINVDFTKLESAIKGSLGTSEEEVVTLETSEVAEYPAEDPAVQEEIK